MENTGSEMPCIEEPDRGGDFAMNEVSFFGSEAIIPVEEVKETITDAISPKATVTQAEGGAKIEIEDVNGKTEAFLEGGTKNYEELRNIPKLNGVVIRGEKTLEDYGEKTITNSEIKELVDKQYKEIFGGE